MSFRLPPPWGDDPDGDPDATIADEPRHQSARTKPALPPNDYAQSPYPLAATPVVRRQSPRAVVVGAGIIAGIVLLVFLLSLASGGRWGLPFFPRSSAAHTPAPPGSPALQPSATTAPATATTAPTATALPMPCALPATTADSKAPSVSNSFHFRFTAGVEAWYNPASEQEPSGSVTLPISLCLPNQSFAQLEQAISVDSTFWHTATPCAAVACWSMASTSLGTPYTLTIALAHTPRNDTGAVFTLTMTTIAANHGSLATSTDTYTIQPNATTADIGEASATSINPLGTALIAAPAAGLTYATLHLSAIAHDCGNAQAAYSARALDVTTMSVICAQSFVSYDV